VLAPSSSRRKPDARPRSGALDAYTNSRRTTDGKLFNAAMRRGDSWSSIGFSSSMMKGASTTCPCVGPTTPSQTSSVMAGGRCPFRVVRSRRAPGWRPGRPLPATPRRGAAHQDCDRGAARRGGALGDGGLARALNDHGIPISAFPAVFPVAVASIAQPRLDRPQLDAAPRAAIASLAGKGPWNVCRRKPAGDKYVPCSIPRIRMALTLISTVTMRSKC